MIPNSLNKSTQNRKESPCSQYTFQNCQFTLDSNTLSMLLPQSLSICSVVCLYCLPPQIHLAHSISPVMCLLKCHLFREALAWQLPTTYAPYELPPTPHHTWLFSIAPHPPVLYISSFMNLLFPFLQLSCKLQDHRDFVYFDVTPVLPAPARPTLCPWMTKPTALTWCLALPPWPSTPRRMDLPGDSVGIQ